MTPHGLVTPATAADAHELEANLRPADRRELEEVSGKPALSGLLLGVLVSDPALTLRTPDGALIGLLGVIRQGPGRGLVWMSGTNELAKRSVAFLRGSRDVIAKLQEQYPTLYNAVDARNEVHIRWLRWLGFHLIRATHQGPNRVPVYEFARIL